MLHTNVKTGPVKGQLWNILFLLTILTIMSKLRKEYEYVLAFSVKSLEDVTTRYTQQLPVVQKRRGKKDNVEQFRDLLQSIILRNHQMKRYCAQGICYVFQVYVYA